MNINTKARWFVAILCVFLVILATNLIDRKNYLKVVESVEKIYDDRLVAKELLLQVSVKFHEKELAYATNDQTYIESRNDQVNAEVKELLKIFDRAEATQKEEIFLGMLKRSHDKLIKLEAETEDRDQLYSTEFSEIFSSINANLTELANEQMVEGRSQKYVAKKAIDSIKIFSKVEIYILIFLALVLQFIILYTPRKQDE